MPLFGSRTYVFNVCIIIMFFDIMPLFYFYFIITVVYLVFVSCGVPRYLILHVNMHDWYTDEEEKNACYDK